MFATIVLASALNTALPTSAPVNSAELVVSTEEVVVVNQVAVATTKRTGGTTEIPRNIDI